MLQSNNYSAFQIACDSFCLDFDKNMTDISAALKADTLSPEFVRFLPIQNPEEEEEGMENLNALQLL